MHIAVLIFGRLYKCIEHYNNVIQHLGQDNQIDFFLSSDNSPEINEFIELYKPKAYDNSTITYDYDLNKYPGKHSVTNIHNMTCHFINKNRVFALFQEYKSNYDCVVSLRIDCLFQSKFDFSKLEENTIYIPEGADWVDKGLNDQIAYGKVDVMEKYNSIDPVYLLENKLSIPHPESLNYANVHLHKLNIERPIIKYYLHR